MYGCVMEMWLQMHRLSFGSLHHFCLSMWYTPLSMIHTAKEYSKEIRIFMISNVRFELVHLRKYRQFFLSIETLAREKCNNTFGTPLARF